MPKVVLQPFQVGPKSFHELIIQPHFTDVLDANGNVTVPSTEEGDWQIMNNVVHTRPIIDLLASGNQLKRRDATCKLIYSPVGKATARYIKTEKLYGATENCQEEFYQGCFEDYEQENWDVFGRNIMPFLEKGVVKDLYSNKYFGDISRAADVNGNWSWNKFDGVFTHYANYIADGTIPADQTFTIADGDITPTAANQALQDAFDAQGDILADMDDADKAFYVNKKLANAYYAFLKSTGYIGLVDQQTGLPAKLFFNGIEIRVKKWDGILKSLNSGTVAHAIILTTKGNFIFGTDTSYGGGPKRNEAARVWYSDDDDVWRYTIHLKAGTQIVSPVHSVIGLTNF